MRLGPWNEGPWNEGIICELQPRMIENFLNFCYISNQFYHLKVDYITVKKMKFLIPSSQTSNVDFYVVFGEKQKKLILT